MRDELDQLWRSERPQVTQAVAEAAAQGDRSENAEYTYGKRRLREIDRRVRFLRKRLEGMTIVDPQRLRRREAGKVFFGAWVELEDDQGIAHRYRVVGPDEFDMAPNYISMDAPLGRAVLGKALDDEIALELNGCTRRYVVTNIRYEDPSS
jgi:transcription elongation factor GreB